MGRKIIIAAAAVITSWLVGLRLIKTRMLAQEHADTGATGTGTTVTGTTETEATDTEAADTKATVTRAAVSSSDMGRGTDTSSSVTVKMRQDRDDPWIKRPEEEVDQDIDIGPQGTDEHQIREKLNVPKLTTRAPRSMALLLVDIIPIFLGMVATTVLGYLGGFIGHPGDADPTGAMFGVYGVQATLIVSVAFLPRTLNQLTFGIIQLLVVTTSIFSTAYVGFHFSWFSAELGLIVAIFLSLFSVIFSAFSIAFAYESRHWRRIASRREKQVLKNDTAFTRWRLRRANLQAYREWCWRHEEDPERFEQVLWESGAFALTYKEIAQAAPSPAMEDFLDSRQGVEKKDPATLADDLIKKQRA